VLQVNSYYGQYNVNEKQAGFPSKSLKGPKQENWLSPSASKKSYTIGILFPHLKDPYFLAVNYGLLNQAKKLNLSFKLLSAGGYSEIEQQKKQFKQLLAEQVDGIILTSISYTALDELVAQTVNSGIPVVEVVNDIYSPSIQAKALVSFYDMGYQAAQFVVKNSTKKQIKVGFFPGPKGSGWAPESLKGFFAVQRKYPGRLRTFPPKWGDTDYALQRQLISDFVKQHPDIDYIVANAVAAEVAIDVLEKQGLSDKIKIVSTYIIPTIYEKIKLGKITAAPSDVTVALGKIAMDMMLRILNGEQSGIDFPFRAGPIIPVISKENIAQYSYEQLFGKPEFKPVFNFSP
ncbi:MAG: TMAO reductase system periplasmic protein TorT, partial [Pseudomonadota bacterium]